MNELDFISALRALATAPAARGLADDAAVLEIGGEALVVTQDAMAEGTHWLPGTDMADVAWKLVAVNLSDLAAKGAEPLGVLLSHSLGEGDARFVEGLREVCEALAVPLLGGDTIRAGGPRTLSLTAIGRATHMPVPSRSGAREGDVIYVCGIVGDAWRGYNALLEAKGETGAPPSLTGHFLRPLPLLDEGRALAPHVTAMMDVSDGLFLDATRMAQASEATFALSLDALPFSDRFLAALPSDPDEARAQRIAGASWGDDYALLFTLPADIEPPVPATRIGTVRDAGEHALLLDGHPPPEGTALGYTH